MSQKILIELKKLLKYVTYYNKLAPFPVFDSDYVNDIKLKIDKMNTSKINYDELPVVACNHCMSLWIENDELENDLCMRCGAVNDIEIFNDIDHYLEAKYEREKE
jgi:hypothetical protein